jgi:hypothetical protein
VSFVRFFSAASQKSGYDLETTSAFSIIIGTLALKEQMPSPFYGHYKSYFNMRIDLKPRSSDYRLLQKYFTQFCKLNSKCF